MKDFTCPYDLDILQQWLLKLPTLKCPLSGEECGKRKLDGDKRDWIAFNPDGYCPVYDKKEVE